MTEQEYITQSVTMGWIFFGGYVLGGIGFGIYYARLKGIKAGPFVFLGCLACGAFVGGLGTMWNLAAMPDDLTAQHLQE